MTREATPEFVKGDFADAVYYTAQSGAGVFESGTQDWVCGMDPYCTGPAQAGHVAPILDAISTRLFSESASGRTPVCQWWIRLCVTTAVRTP